MRHRDVPAIATWFVKLFCSGPEHESAIGDLLEQYQHGRGRFWYWRQSLVLAFVGIRDRIVRRPLAPKIDVLGLPRIDVEWPMTSAAAFPKMRDSGIRETPVQHLHRGINSSNVAGEGFEGLPGLLMAIAFVFIFLGLFMPRNTDWLGGLFFIAEIGASVLYLAAGRRERRDSEEAARVLHQINEQQDRTHGNATHTK